MTAKSMNKPDGSAPPDLSIVVPTLDRAGSLSALLAALIEQDAGGVAFEVVVVDNGSIDGTRQVVACAAARDPRIRYIEESRRGASHARNAGIARARAPIVAFLDDDVIPAHDWIRVLSAELAANPDVDCVGGRVEPQWPPHVPPWLTRRHYAPLALQLDRPLEFDADHASACLITANFACRRPVFDDVGLFATSFSRDEDREFNLRLWRAGKRGRYVDRLRVVAPVVPERLTKRYHRRWHETTGRNHARMQFRDVVDHSGRLVPAMRRRRLLGTPAFVYRECLAEGLRWIAAVARGTRGDAFFYECRVRYFTSYIAERARVLLRPSA